MKVKATPEDFIVDEILTLPELQAAGGFAVFRLDKRNLSTLDVVSILAGRHRIRDGDISFAGIKDKYALTSQYLSVRGGKLQEIRERNFTLTPLGRADDPITSSRLLGNRFKITLRHLLDSRQTTEIAGMLGEAAEFGFVNYFGEQRFGSARAGAGFIAKSLMRGDCGGALKILLASSSGEDKAAVREERESIRENWGDWDACLKSAASPVDREIFLHLKRYPRDFERAVNLIPRRMLHLYLAAYQSYLWNETAAHFIEKTLEGADSFIRFKCFAGEMVFYRKLSEAQATRLGRAQIPLLDHKSAVADGEIRAVSEAILEREGITPAQFKLGGVKATFFKSASRELIARPGEMQIFEPQADELYPQRMKLSLSFTLPPGSYASVLLRRVGAGAGEDEFEAR
ncbi:MAG: tRNA pseudouridine(13) synthase TruD [Deltaproteobacteria bacterium]